MRIPGPLPPAPPAPDPPAPTHSGALPFRRRTDGGLDVLLVTSSTQRRWVCPKGRIEPDLTARANAAKEAFEEAGIRGYVYPRPLGRYRHLSRGGPDLVELYAMEVLAALDAWPEQALRERAWVPLAEAIARLDEPDLQALLRGLPAYLGATPHAGGPE